MNASRIVRIQVANATQDYVVLQSSSIGPEALDLQLVGTDEEAAYVGRIKHNAHAELRSNPVNINNDDWTCALSSVFAPNDHMAPKADIEVLAKVDADRMTLIIRKNVQGITQRLGEIILRQDPDTEIRLFEWAAIAASATDHMRHTSSSLQSQVEQQRKRITKLQTQLDDLGALKSAHEDALLEKFALLLNAKKLKIRDQQRLLAHAKVDSAVASSVNATRHRYATSSAMRKRKANPADLSDESSDDNIDTADDNDEEDRVGRSDHSMDDTNSESDGELLDAKPARSTQEHAELRSQSHSQAPLQQRSPALSRPATQQHPERKAASSQISEPPPTTATADGDDDDTTDDEL